MLNLPISIFTFYLAFFLGVSFVGGKRSKRLINGLIVNDPDQVGSQFMVALTQANACYSPVPEGTTSTEYPGEELSWCDSYQHYCGGSLIQPDFALTACHCLIHEEFYEARVPLPTYRPAYTNLTSSTVAPEWFADGLGFYVRMQPKHPIYNRMALWMGGLDQGLWGGKLQQRRFAKAFFPHSACIWREYTLLDRINVPASELNKLQKPAYDVGLVRTWVPFTLNKDVALVPLKFGDDLEKSHNWNLRKMSICITLGWGLYEEGKFRPSQQLRYSYRNVFCVTPCYTPGEILKEKEPRCHVCTTSIERPDKGILSIDIANMDSGGPLICEHDSKRYQMGVVNRTFKHVGLFSNITKSLFAAVRCIDHLLTKEHTSYLRTLHDGQLEKGIFKEFHLDVSKAPMGVYT